MNREEAIKRIEDHIHVHRIGEYPHVYISEALQLALSALRAEIEREGKTCDGCAYKWQLKNQNKWCNGCVRMKREDRFKPERELTCTQD